MALNIIEDIRNELLKLKTFRKKTHEKLNAERLKTFKGFENLSLEKRQQILETLQEYANIVVRQLNRLIPRKDERH